jgi:hypothetical protein
MIRQAISIFTLIGLMVVIGCKTESGEANKKQDTISVIQKDSLYSEKGRQVKKIFYNVPSPIEMARLIKKAGSYYNKELLNPLNNRTKYISNEKMALNLGVYGADLSYARLYDQIQVCIDYLKHIRKLSESLGIPDEEGAATVGKLQDHMENRDTLLQIIAETYSHTDTYLKENDRESTAILVLIGGWVEALYLAVNTIDMDNPHHEILERIAEQKYSLSNMIELAKGYEHDEAVAYYRPKLEKLYEAFSGIIIVYSLKDVSTDAENKLTTINSNTDIIVTIDDIKEIKKIVAEIRKEIIS